MAWQAQVLSAICVFGSPSSCRCCLLSQEGGGPSSEVASAAIAAKN